MLHPVVWTVISEPASAATVVYVLDVAPEIAVEPLNH
jgi:hypothetical protein